MNLRFSQWHEFELAVSQQSAISSSTPRYVSYDASLYSSYGVITQAPPSTRRASSERRWCTCARHRCVAVRLALCVHLEACALCLRLHDRCTAIACLPLAPSPACIHCCGRSHRCWETSNLLNPDRRFVCFPAAALPVAVPRRAGAGRADRSARGPGHFRRRRCHAREWRCVLKVFNCYRKPAAVEFLARDSTAGRGLLEDNLNHLR